MSGRLCIPYGNPVLAGPPAAVAPAVEILRDLGTPLRLSDGPYPFPEPPDLVRAATVPERLALLREHLRSLCGLWDKPARGFVEAYFRFIAAAIAEGDAELAALAETTGGLFAPEDWSFAALRPLPQAYPTDGTIRADFAFWTGDEIVAIELVGSATPRRKRREELARLREGGVAVVEIPTTALQGESALASLLPAQFRKFWSGVVLPSSPFRPQGLDDFRSP